MKILLPWRIFQSLSLSGRLGLVVTLVLVDHRHLRHLVGTPQS